MRTANSIEEEGERDMIKSSFYVDSLTEVCCQLKATCIAKPSTFNYFNSWLKKKAQCLSLLMFPHYIFTLTSPSMHTNFSNGLLFKFAYFYQTGKDYMFWPSL